MLGEIVEQARGPKVIAFKKRRRKNSKRKRGHKQDLTIVRITAICRREPRKRAAPAAVRIRSTAQAFGAELRYTRGAKRRAPRQVSERKMAHKKAGGSSRNGRDSDGRRLGVKKFGGEQVLGGNDYRSPARHQMASRPQCRHGQGPHAFRHSSTARSQFERKANGRSMRIGGRRHKQAAE